MTKSITTISLDSDLKQKAKTLNINLSKVANDVLANLINSYTDDDIDLYEIQKEIDLIDNKITEIQSRKTELITQRTSFYEKQEQKRKKDVKEQVKLAESIKRSGLL